MEENTSMIVQMLNKILMLDYVKRVREHFPIMDVKDFRYIRIGQNLDGGYIMVDDFDDVKVAYSCGINNDVSWDMDFVRYTLPNGGADIFMYDHTIDRLPYEMDHFHWDKTGITGIYDPEHPELETLPRLIRKNGHQNDYNMILKMDIEGAEYDSLINIDIDTLNHFSQIVIEFHDLIRTQYENRILFSLDKLNATHQLVHIHGNNCGDKVEIESQGGLVLPITLEATYLRKDKYEFVESKRFFPTNLDRPCDPRKPDINLGFWK